MLATNYPVTPHHIPEKWKTYAHFFCYSEARSTHKQLLQAPPRYMFFVFKYGENPGNPRTLYSWQTDDVLMTDGWCAHDRRVMHLFRELKVAGKWRTIT